MPAFHSGLETFNCAESRQGDRGIMSLKFVFSPNCPFLPLSPCRGKGLGQRAAGCPGVLPGRSALWVPARVSGAGDEGPTLVSRGRVGRAGSYVCEVIMGQGIARRPLRKAPGPCACDRDALVKRAVIAEPTCRSPQLATCGVIL